MQVYIDESKAKAYLLVAVLIAPGDAPGFRKRMIALRMPRQRHIHFVNERDSRRKMILDELFTMGVKARVYLVSGLNPIVARAVCFEALLDDLKQIGANTLVIETEESARKTDVFLIRHGLAIRKLNQSVEYRHAGKSEEPLLWIADAIAWSFARGGHFKKRALELVENVKVIAA